MVNKRRDREILSRSQLKNICLVRIQPGPGCLSLFLLFVSVAKHFGGNYHVYLLFLLNLPSWLVIFCCDQFLAINSLAATIVIIQVEEIFLNQSFRNMFTRKKSNNILSCKHISSVYRNYHKKHYSCSISSINSSNLRSQFVYTNDNFETNLAIIYKIRILSLYVGKQNLKHHRIILQT